MIHSDFEATSALLRLETAIAPELQRSAVLRDCPDDIVGSACGNLSLYFEGHSDV